MPSTENDALVDVSLRVAMYEFLSELWLSEPDVDKLKAIAELRPTDGEIVADLQRFAASFVDDAEALAVRYCELFIGPKNHLPPFQSVWAEGQLSGESMASLNQFVSVLGSDSEEEVDDHLGSLLAMMSSMLSDATTVSAANRDDLTSLLRSFFAHHLMWVDMLLQAVRQRDDGFYAALARLTQQFLAGEATRLATQVDS